MSPQTEHFLTASCEILGEKTGMNEVEEILEFQRLLRGKHRRKFLGYAVWSPH